MKELSVAVLVPCAGSSSRLGLGLKKEYINVTPEQGDTVLYRALVPFFLASGCIIRCPRGEDKIFALVSVVVVIPPETGIPLDAVSKFSERERDKISFCAGGETRQKSVLNGLKYLCGVMPDVVLIHDGARPFVSKDLVIRVTENVVLYGACAPCTKVTDTVKAVGTDGFVSEHLKRDFLRAVQTPQGFLYKDIYEAHVKGDRQGFVATDDTELLELLGKKTFLCEGELGNTKITYPGDLDKLRERI